MVLCCQAGGGGQMLFSLSQRPISMHLTCPKQEVGESTCCTPSIVKIREAHCRPVYHLFEAVGPDICLRHAQTSLCRPLAITSRLELNASSFERGSPRDAQRVVTKQATKMF